MGKSLEMFKLACFTELPLINELQYFCVTYFSLSLYVICDAK